MDSFGNGSTAEKNKLAQIASLEDIEQIEVGEDFGIAIDNLGIVYGWGSNKNGQLGTENIGKDTLTPSVIKTDTQRVIDISAGEEQSVYVTAKGTVNGYGKLLNGKIDGIENAIKAEVTKESIIILTAENEVYKYENGSLTQIVFESKVIDISGTNETVMYQTVDEKTYVTGENTYGELGLGTNNIAEEPTLVNAHGESTYGIGAGYKNTYIIETTGNVYSAGENTYGSLGNGTREASLEHLLIGNRAFEIMPETATMRVRRYRRNNSNRRSI